MSFNYKILSRDTMRRRQFHGKTISINNPSVWKKIESLEGDFVYFLLNDGEVVYVGQAYSLYRRLRSHMWIIGGHAKQFNQISYRSVSKEEDIYQVERHFIRMYLPKYNNLLYHAVRNPYYEAIPERVQVNINVNKVIWDKVCEQICFKSSRNIGEFLDKALNAYINQSNKKCITHNKDN